jgi:cardiolipin synthase
MTALFGEHGPIFWAWIVLTVHVFGAGVAAYSVFHPQSPQGTVAWAIALLFVPWVALPAYLVVGRHRLTGYAERMREVGLAEDSVARLDEVLEPFRAPAGGDGDLESVAESFWTRGASAEVLVDGEATFDAIFAAVDEAKSYVLVSFYIIRDDGLGARFERHLAAAVSRGVEVCLLYDDVGSGRGGRRYARRLAAVGVRVSVFGARAGWRDRLGMNYRNHRKAVVVDGRVAFVGGHNIGDEYLGLHPRLTPWRDTHLSLRGPAVLAIQRAWLRDWVWASREQPNVSWEAGPAGSLEALAFPTGPLPDYPVAALLFASLFGKAKRRLWIATPYFVPTPGVDLALRLAAKRGVDVRIMLPRLRDHYLSALAALVCLESHRDSGVRFFRSREGFVHQKVVLVDDELAMIGSANLDYRSIVLNFEIGVVVRGRELAASVERMLEADLAASVEIEGPEYDQRAWPVRLAARVAWLAAPLL